MSTPRRTHRDALLDAAKRLLRERDYGNITARDLVAASNTNLGSIGYHFGSKEALLNEAVIRGCEQWTIRLGEAAAASPETSPLEQMATSWVALLGALEEMRPVLVGFIEAVGQSAWSEELREQMATHYRRVRLAITEMVRASLGPAAEELGADPKVVASFLLAVCDGLAMQWLLDPEETPSGEEFVASLGAALGAALQVQETEAAR